ncbi:MAG: efflux RND transporter periplasmic adaptor subunit [Parvularculaceae bacterium]
MASREETGFNARDHEPAGYRLRTDVTITASVDPQTSRKHYYVKSGETGEVFDLGEEEYFFCVRLDGRVSFAEFRHAFEAHFGAKLTFEKFKSFADDLVGMRVLEYVSGDAFAQAASALIEDILDPEDHDPRATPFRRTLLDPSRFFDALAALGPLGRVLSIAIWPLVAIALAILAHNTGAVLRSFLISSDDISIFIIIPVGLFCVNLIVKIMQGAAAHREGAAIRGLGVIFFFGFFPRFYIEENAIAALDDEPQRRVYATGLKTRLFLWSVFLILWAAFQAGGGFLPEAFVLISHLAFAAFLWNAVPFMKNDGYHWMSLLMGQPQLRERSLLFLRLRAARKPAPPDMTAVDQTCAILYGLACLLYMTAVIILLFAFISVELEGSLGGAGVAIALGLMGLAFAWYLSSRHAAERVRATVRANRPGLGGRKSAASPSKGAVIQLASRPAPARTSPAQMQPRKAVATKMWPRFVWFGAALAFLILMLWPYQYKPGGEFLVLPNDRHQVNARIEGEIAEIFVKEGQWVEKGAPLVRINNWQLERQLAESEAELDRSNAVLQRLIAGAKKEEIALAQSQVASAASRLKYKKTELARNESLLKEGVTTVRAVEQKRAEHAAAISDLNVAKANLAVVKSGATVAELDAARAEVRRLENEVSFRKEDLERTRVFAPAAGAIVTANPDLRGGAYLRTGDLIVEIEDTRTARIEISLAEADLRYIKVGDRVQVKPWGYSNETMIGAVAGIAPAADESKANRYIRVLTELSNADHRLRPQMSGYGKVEGEMMQVWRAYLLFFIRFVEVEVWSWLP